MDRKEVAEILKKEYIGTKVRYLGAPFHIETVRYVKGLDKILVYNRDNWCCDAEILQTADKTGFLVDTVKVKE